MIINKNLGGIHFYLDKSDAGDFLSFLKEFLDKYESTSFILENADNRSYSILNISLSDDEHDYMEIKSSLISLRLSYDSIDLAINKIEQFLVNCFFITPEWCECENKEKIVPIYFMNK